MHQFDLLVVLQTSRRRRAAIEGELSNLHKRIERFERFEGLAITFNPR